MRREPQRRPKEKVESSIPEEMKKWCGMWQFYRKRGNHMMLDNKSEQK